MKRLLYGPMGGMNDYGGAMPSDNDGDEGGEIPVPLASLAQPDDQEQMKTPEEGDTVDFQVSATVSRIEGDCAYVIPTAVNGKPLENEANEGPDEDEQEGNDLRQQAMSMSGQGQGGNANVPPNS